MEIILKNSGFFVNKIKKWGEKNYRKFPWREEKNTFRLMLTEIFLQQTDSQKINKIYPLIKKFKTPRDVLKKKYLLTKIIKKIGLNYRKYRVIILCHQLIKNHNGKIPNDYDQLITLYGVGDYIASALICFAFKKRMPVIDTNTIRILQSFFGYRSEKKRPRTDKKIKEFFFKILPKKNYLNFNYYLLDFGALVCTSRKKECKVCPVHLKCDYHNLSKNKK